MSFTQWLVASGGTLLWWGLAVICVGAAIAVVAQKNPVNSALFLVVAFLAVAGLFLIRHAEFLAAVQVFVYAGGIIVLFLFVIFLVNIDRLRVMLAFQRQWGAGLLGGALVLAILIAALWLGGVQPGVAAPDMPALTAVDGQQMGNSQAIGWALYTRFLVPFEVASVLLLVAMIGAIALGKKDAAS